MYGQCYVGCQGYVVVLGIQVRCVSMVAMGESGEVEREVGSREQV